MPATRVGWSKPKVDGRKVRNDPRTKAVVLMELAAAFGRPFRLRDLVKFPTHYAKAWDAIIDDGRIVCVNQRERVFRVTETLLKSSGTCGI